MWKVNLRKDEYTRLQKELADYHEKELTNIKQGITDIKELLEGESFRLDQTTRNLLQLLGTIETGIIPLIENTFENTEQSVDTVITGFKNIDTIC
ncbi:MAG: hypothetical protein HFJ06_01095 [Lachnospiraceae bacterium]|nr:hypothetical protein [Lachnospiraceae bacterium]